MARDRDWHDFDGSLVQSTWIEETGGWLVTFGSDQMRKDHVDAAVWMPSRAVWGSPPPVPPLPPKQIWLVADLTEVTHREQPAPI